MSNATVNTTPLLIGVIKVSDQAFDVVAKRTHDAGHDFKKSCTVLSTQPTLEDAQAQAMHYSQLHNLCGPAYVATCRL